MRSIGIGRWSEVYLGRDEKNGNAPVAIKILKSEEVADEDVVTRFRREVQLMQQLHHSNIAKVYSSGLTDDGRPYLISEYSPSGDLQRFLDSYRTGHPPFLLGLNLLRLIARGVAHAHERQILHRDLKPENILLTPSRSVKLTDFGIGRSLMFQGGSSDGVIGTPYYMAPEQFSRGASSPQSDVYSIGILAYQLFTGKLPFDADHAGRLMYQHCFDQPPSLVFKGGKIPCWAEDIVHRACEKEANNRQADAGEFLEELERWSSQEKASLRGLPKMLFMVRPGGKICSLAAERGIPRSWLGIGLLAVFTLLFAVITLSLL